MNIYLHVESSVRELDSKLLLATIAAAKGHKILVSNLSGIVRGIRNGFLSPGIFHTKSITPGERKIKLHDKIIEKGFIITSIDEEGGLVDYGYEKFANIRYSKKTVEQTSAIFCWGRDDFYVLNKLYPESKSKIFLTGSPRSDLWKPSFSKYWDSHLKKPQRPYLLISSNMGIANNKINFEKFKKQHELSGYYTRDPEMLNWHKGLLKEEDQMIASYVKAIKYLASKNSFFDIVLRPHPVEKILTWKMLLKNIPNVHVIQDGPISTWINHCFAVMQNGCTTSFEATISEKPVISFLPFKQKFSREFANDLGHIVKTNEELDEKINFFYNQMINGQKNKIYPEIKEKVFKKIYFDEDELACEKIINIWEKISKNNLNKNNNWTKFENYLRFMKKRDSILSFIKKLFHKNFSDFDGNFKFPPLNNYLIEKKINNFKQTLGIKSKISCKFLTDRTLFISKL